MEFHGLQVLLVFESIACERHRAVRRVYIVVVVETSIDDGIRGGIIHILDVGVINQVFLRCGDDISTANHAHLMNIGKDVLTHTLVHQFRIVGATAAPNM